MKHNKIHVSYIAAASGFIIGAVFALNMILLRFNFASPAFHYKLFLILSLTGAATSLLFCSVVSRALSNRRDVLILSVVSAVVAAFLFTTLFFERDHNIILLVSDATRASHLHCYGYQFNTTPNLDSLAEDGIRFDKAIAQGSHTVVATPSIIASIYPSQHGMTTYRDVLSDSVVTIAEVLRDNGYRTMGISTNPHLTKETGFDQGYMTYRSNKSWLNTDAKNVVDNFLGWLDGHAGSRFFAFLFLIDPHSPYEPPAPFLKQFGGDETFIVNDWHLDTLALYEGQERKELIARYDGELAYLDFHLGRLFSDLKERDLYDKTMIVYTSDHGEAFWEHVEVGHGHSLYEELIRVPLIVKLPFISSVPALRTADMTINDPVCQIDIMPTILDFFNIKKPKTSLGISLLPLVFREESWANRMIFSEEILLQVGPYNIRSVRSGNWKFILDQNFPGGEMTRELFDLENDPHERVNLVEKKNEIARNLERELIVFMGRMERKSLASGRSNIPTRSMLESLKALGYIQ